MPDKNPEEKSKQNVIHSDQPTVNDELEFTPYVNSLTDIILDNVDTPLTIGIYGPWGTGKTSLMMMVAAEIKKRGGENPFPTVWFDAWKYDKEDALWRALILRVINGLREEAGLIDDAPDEETEGNGKTNEAEDKEEKKKKEKIRRQFDDLESSLYKVVEREELGNVQVDMGNLVKGGAKTLLHLGLHMLPGVGSAFSELLKESQEQLASGDINTIFDAIKRERHKIYREHVNSLEQFQDKFKRLVDKFLKKNKRLIIFVDDLDRCAPEKIIEVLESIKLFMDVPRCVFVLGLDQEVIIQGIEIKYKKLGFTKDTEEEERRFVNEGNRYLEKIIQLPFQIPSVQQDDMKKYIAHLLGQDQGTSDEEWTSIFSIGLKANPRSIKRNINSFFLLERIAESRNKALKEKNLSKEELKEKEIKLDRILLAKIIAIQQIWPDLYNLLREDPGLLIKLEEYFYKNPDGTTISEPQSEADLDVSEEEYLPAPLLPYIGRRKLPDILTLPGKDRDDGNFHKLNEGDIIIYFTLTKRTESPEMRRSIASTAATNRDFEPPTVFVEGGPFKIGASDDEVKYLSKELGIGDKFFEAERPQSDYTLGDFWISRFPITNKEYEHFLRDSKHVPPAHWEEGIYPEGEGGHPVVNVSWHDANAYCKWLSGQTDKQYTLPTERQWEKAARGPEGNLYPWGPKWDDGLSNGLDSSGRQYTTPVGKYSPEGDSFYGCSDMVGNVWEWCEDVFESNAYKEKGAADSVTSVTSSTKRVVRGGSYLFRAPACRCTIRSPLHPDRIQKDCGFRVVVVSNVQSDATQA